MAVDLEKKQVHVEFEPIVVSLGQIKETIDDQGYDVE